MQSVLNCIFSIDQSLPFIRSIIDLLLVFKSQQTIIELNFFMKVLRHLYIDLFLKNFHLQRSCNSKPDQQCQRQSRNSHPQLFAFTNAVFAHRRNKKAVEVENDQPPDNSKTDPIHPVIKNSVNGIACSK